VTGALRVASFNIRTGLGFDGCNSWWLRRRATVRTLAAIDADIAGLQEVHAFQLRWLLRRLPQYAVAAGAPRGRRTGERCPVLVRRSRVRIVDVGTRWYGERWRSRIATTCRVEVSGVGDVLVCNTHLDERDPDVRLDAAAQLAASIDTTQPCIVTGDLNATPDDPVLKHLRAAGLHDALPADAGGTVHRFTGRIDGRRLDYILMSEHWAVDRAWVATERYGNKLASDHWPVAADVTFGPVGADT
jgi:endonuclease/exonuclease/phosphatase family metal-dependent hydrolase